MRFNKLQFCVAKKFLKVLFVILLGCITTQGNAQKKDGYVVSYEGAELKTFYGECVHSAYYDRSTEEREACGGKKPQPPINNIPKTIIETVVITDEDDVLFNFDTATLTLYGNRTLSKFINKTGRDNIVKIIIDGYTDAIGTSEYNLKLSKERADSVRNFFIAHGFLSNKITTHGYGEKDVKVSNLCVNKYPQNKPHLRTQLIKCTAADRKVIITVEHERQTSEPIIEPSPAKDRIVKTTPK